MSCLPFVAALSRAAWRSRAAASITEVTCRSRYEIPLAWSALGPTISHGCRRKEEDPLDPESPGLDDENPERRRALLKPWQLPTEELFQVAVRAGIYGELAEPYRGTEPSTGQPTDTNTSSGEPRSERSPCAASVRIDLHHAVRAFCGVTRSSVAMSPPRASVTCRGSSRRCSFDVRGFITANHFVGGPRCSGGARGPLRCRRAVDCTRRARIARDTRHRLRGGARRARRATAAARFVARRRACRATGARWFPGR